MAVAVHVAVPKVCETVRRNRTSAETTGTVAWAKRSCAMDQERIIAVGLLTRRDLNLLGPTFDRVFPVEDVPQFDELLKKIDEVERSNEGGRN